MTSTRMRKPGREAYTLLDKSFFYGLGEVSRKLLAHGVKHALYGGVGLQAHFSRRLAGQNSMDATPSLVQYLRPTGDYDLAVEADLTREKLFGALGKLDGSVEEFSDGFYSTRVVRFGEKRTQVEVTRLSNDGDEDVNVQVTFYNEEERHQNMVREAQPVRLIYAPLEIEIPCAPLEATVAGKLSRAGIKRDIVDVINVLELFPETDLDAVGKILTEIGRKQPHVYGMRSRVSEGRDKFLQYLRQLKEASDKQS